VFIEIEDLQPEPLHVHHVFQTGEIRFSHEDAVISDPVTADFLFEHKDRDLHIAGTVETEIRFKCSRCAREYKKGLSTGFDLTYLPQTEWPNEHVEVELKYEDMDVAYYDGIAFDVDLMVLEQLELAMPMKFVCKEDCKGLCDQCGADLNEGICRCIKETGDMRLSALLDFRKKMGG
jgi:uncharacterized protein